MFPITTPRARGARASLLGLAILGLLTGTACGDDTATASTLDVEMADFHYGGLPDTVTAGTEITVHNDSEHELHELVAVRLPDGDDRAVSEIVESDLGELFAAGPPSLVVLAEPGSADNVVAVGDGTLTEPGRYLLICTIPTGVDPGTYLHAAAASNGEPPQVDGGPPHFVHGMYAELTVTPA